MKRSGALPAIDFEFHNDSVTLNLSGDLGALVLAPIERTLSLNTAKLEKKHLHWNLENITHLDTAGVLMILSFNRRMARSGGSSEMHLPHPGFSRLFHMVVGRHNGETRAVSPRKESYVERVGRKTLGRLEMLAHLLAFFGRASAVLFSYMNRLEQIRYKEIAFEMNESAIKALGIIGLTTFLIGVVIAYQSSVQLKLYGANIFIVDMLGIGILRELAPLLTAIVVAGRSGSAYAAQIGVMKITEELDAMRTMGFDPHAFLVLPRILALMLMMPLLIFFADIMGVLGGMLIAYIELGISPELFLERFSRVIDVRHFWVGVFKGPFFAVLIASIGIFRGLMVKNDTQSIGFNTTKSVVESIFAVIICDAVFSIIFTNLDL